MEPATGADRALARGKWVSPTQSKWCNLGYRNVMVPTEDLEECMRLVSLRCQACGANLDVDSDGKWATCQYCGARFLVEDNAQQAVASNKGHQSSATGAGGQVSTKRILIMGGVLFALTFISYATHFGLRVLGLSVQEWCTFVYAVALIGYYRGSRSKAARVFAIAFWILASVVLVLQIVMWINNHSFTLLTLP